jgi:isopenicillin N synthase-like dioxygenase
MLARTMRPDRGVPLIDLAPARHGDRVARLTVAHAIDEACREIGFFALVGHGVPDGLVEGLRRRAHQFFELPLAEKLKARHPVVGTNRGYHPVGGEALATANDDVAPPDLKEFFHVGPVDVTGAAYYTSAAGRRHFEPNLWPSAPAGFEEAATSYYRTMSRLIGSLMRLAALALDVDEAFFDDKVDRHDAIELLPGSGDAAATGPAARRRPHRLRRLHGAQRRGRAGRLADQDA